MGAVSTVPVRMYNKIPNNSPGMVPDKLLFTPGPLTTSHVVKESMLRDYGSRDTKFVQIINEVRSGLLKLAGLDANEFTLIPVQGSGTFGVEATITSVVPQPDKGGLLIIKNGAYGERIEKICKIYGIKHVSLEFPDYEQPCVETIDKALSDNPDLTHVVTIHSETTSGIVNDIESIGKVVAKHGKDFIVDAMSSFGAVPIDFAACHIDYLVTSSNKNVQGVPGFSIAFARTSKLEASRGNARTLR